MTSNLNDFQILMAINIFQVIILLLNIYIAHIKFRNKFTWFVLTLFFSFYATVMLILANKETDINKT
jgi:hypothetical protein